MVCFVIVLAAWIMGKKHIDPQDYITVTYNGINGYASAECSVDSEKLYKTLAGKEVNMEKLTAYRKFADSLEAHIEKSDISNGDKLTVYVEYDTQAAADSGVRVAGSSYNIRAKGIGNGTKIDLFSNVEVVFAGISPEAYVVINNKWDDEYLSALEFVPYKHTGISKDDVICVKCSAELDKDLVRQIDEECKKTITSQTQDKTFRMMYRATSDTSYLYKANDERAENINLMEIKFLKRKNSLEGGNENYIYYFYSADVVNGDSTDTVYFAFVFSQVYISYDGKFQVAVDDYKTSYTCSTDYNKLYEECIGSRQQMYDILNVEKIK